jgi:hypothetical protein
MNNQDLMVQATFLRLFAIVCMLSLMGILTYLRVKKKITDLQIFILAFLGVVTFTLVFWWMIGLYKVI